MPKEFFDLVCRVPADQAVPFMCVVAKKFPEAQLSIGEEDMNLIAEKREYKGILAWQEELDNLRGLVKGVETAVQAEDPFAIAGFNELYKRRSFYLRQDGDYYIGGPEGFRRKAIDICAKTVLTYGDCVERPGYVEPRVGKAFVYKRLPDCITPRDLRFLVGGFALNGVLQTPDALAEREGVSSGSQAERIAVKHLMRMLAENARRNIDY